MPRKKQIVPHAIRHEQTQETPAPPIGQIISGGVGLKRTLAWHTCRSANNINSPTNGRIVVPRIELTSRKTPSASITAELEINSAFRAPTCVHK